MQTTRNNRFLSRCVSLKKGIVPFLNSCMAECLVCYLSFSRGATVFLRDRYKWKSLLAIIQTIVSRLR